MKNCVPKLYPVYRTTYTSHNIYTMYMTRYIHRIITIRYLYLTLYNRQRVYRSLIFTLTNKAIDSRRRIGWSVGGDSSLPCGLIFVIGPSKTCAPARCRRCGMRLAKNRHGHRSKICNYSKSSQSRHDMVRIRAHSDANESITRSDRRY